MKNHAATHPAPLRLPQVGSAPDRFIRLVVDHQLLLPAAALIALVWANTASESYFRFSHATAFAVNEIAMAFFLGLLMQEVMEAMMPGGPLHTWRRWAMPLIAAAGGIVGAVATYLAYVQLKYEVVLTQAWPIACAIDLAAAYYALKTIWRRGSALPFLLLLALASNVFGVLVIAFQPSTLIFNFAGVLLMGAALGVAVVLRLRKVRSFVPYLAISGPLSWWALYVVGIHPAFALIPVVPFLPRQPRSIDVFADPQDDGAVHHFEHEWNELVQLILFLFVLVNAGVILRGYGTGTWALLAAGLIGRPLGILLAVGLALVMGLHLPRRIGWRGLIVIGLATSSGFAFALFLATGLLAPGPVLTEIKIGALSTVAAAFVAMAAARLLRVGRFA
jgi:NhaA family Na+:H+ antiporter